MMHDHTYPSTCLVYHSVPSTPFSVGGVQLKLWGCALRPLPPSRLLGIPLRPRIRLDPLKPFLILLNLRSLLVILSTQGRELRFELCDSGVGCGAYVGGASGMRGILPIGTSIRCPIPVPGVSSDGRC